MISSVENLILKSEDYASSSADRSSQASYFAPSSIQHVLSHRLPVWHSIANTAMPSSFPYHYSPLKTKYDSLPHLIAQPSLEPKMSESPETTTEPNIKRKRTDRDPLSHRIIEKRRRDRMNNCLANLSKLIPQAYLKKGRGRVEKTEIIEMAIKYMKQVQQGERKQRQHSTTQHSCEQSAQEDKATETTEECNLFRNNHEILENNENQLAERYHQGFFDCIAETLKFLAGCEGLLINDVFESQLLAHLRQYFNCSTLACVNQHISHQMLPTEASMPHSSCTNKAKSSSCESSDEEQPLNMCTKEGKQSKSAGAAALDIRSLLPYSAQLKEILQASKHEHPQQLLLLEQQQLQRASHAAAALPLLLTAAESSTTQPVAIQHSRQQHPQQCGAGSVLFYKGNNGGNSSPSSSSVLYPSSPHSNHSWSSSAGSHTSPIGSPRRAQTPPIAQSSNACSLPMTPIFALHHSGLYYLPMTIHTSTLLISQHLAAPPVAAHDLSQFCHPVTINVNFTNCFNDSSHSIRTVFKSNKVNCNDDSADHQSTTSDDHSSASTVSHSATREASVIYAAASSSSI